VATAVALAPVDPGDIIPLDPYEIDLGERLRPIDEAWAAAIGQSMKRDGQIHAVDVRRAGDGWQLAGAGGHRVTGARAAGIPIDVRVVEFDRAFSRRREVAENLFRRANDPLERAEAIAELVRLHREKAGIAEASHRDQSMPKRVREEAEGTLETISNVYGWSEEIGEQIGLTGRTVRNDLFLYRGLRPSVVALLRDKHHPLLKNASQLRALAKLEAPEQERVAVAMIDVGYGAAKSVSEAIRMLRGSNSVRQSVEDKRLSTFIGTFDRMSVTEKRGALAQLAGMLPAPFKLVEERS
jgi:ParB family chromosome partitioning protein